MKVREVIADKLSNTINVSFLPSSVTFSGNYDVLNDMVDGRVVTATLELADTPHTVLWKSDRGETEGTFEVPVKPQTRVEFCVEMDIEVDDDEATEGKVPIGFNIRLRPTVERTLTPGEYGPDAQRALKLKSHADCKSVLKSGWRCRRVGRCGETVHTVDYR